MSKKGTSREKPLSFEEALERLGEVVTELESEAITLERSLDLFAEGQQLGNICQTLLESATQQVQTLVSSSTGTGTLSDLQQSESDG